MTTATTGGCSGTPLLFLTLLPVITIQIASKLRVKERQELSEEVRSVRSYMSYKEARGRRKGRGEGEGVSTHWIIGGLRLLWLRLRWVRCLSLLYNPINQDTGCDLRGVAYRSGIMDNGSIESTSTRRRGRGRGHG